MAILLIGPQELADIAAAKERARLHPVMLETVRAGAIPGRDTVRLADRKPGWKRPFPSQQVLIRFGYRAAITVEEQPAGMCWHLSVSVERDDPKWRPTPEAVTAICAAFGINFADSLEHGMVWQEEYEPDRFAINVLSVFAAHTAGHA